jgi:hypothetical protein
VFGKTIITNFSFCGASAHIFVTKRFRWMSTIPSVKCRPEFLYRYISGFLNFPQEMPRQYPKENHYRFDTRSNTPLPNYSFIQPCLV